MEVRSSNPTTLIAVVPTTIPPEQAARNRQLIQAVKAVNQSELAGSNREFTFAIDRDTRRPVIHIVDRTTKEVVEQIPVECLLRYSEALQTNASPQ